MGAVHTGSRFVGSSKLPTGFPSSSCALQAYASGCPRLSSAVTEHCACPPEATGFGCPFAGLVMFTSSGTGFTVSVKDDVAVCPFEHVTVTDTVYWTGPSVRFCGGTQTGFCYVASSKNPAEVPPVSFAVQA